VVWKPTPTQQLAAHHTMRLLEAAGLPPGVINLVTGDGAAVSEVALPDQDFRRPALHRVDKTFKYLWRRIGENLDHYRSLPEDRRRGPAARTSAWRIRRRSPRRWPPRWSGARSSTRARSAPQRPAPYLPRSLWRAACVINSSR